MIMSDIRNENQQYIYVLDAEYQNVERHTESTDLKECSQVNPVQSNPFQSRKFKWSRINTCILLAAVLIATCMSFVSVILFVGMANERVTNTSKTLFEDQSQLLNKLSEMKKNMDNLEATKALKTLSEDQKQVLDTLSQMKKFMDNLEGRYFTIGPRDCSDIRSNQSGIYTIYPDDVHYVSVYCDMTTESRGLTVFQRRLDGTTNFLRRWDDYKRGFGDLNGEFWIGNENLHIMTTARSYMVQIDLKDFVGNTKFATYSVFKVGNETSKYKLRVDGYVGTAGDSFGRDNGAFFSTYDRDNDNGRGHCAKNERKGGWWYRNCGGVNLNGPYQNAKYEGWAGIYWWGWHNNNALKSTRMSIKPI